MGQPDVAQPIGQQPKGSPRATAENGRLRLNRWVHAARDVRLQISERSKPIEQGLIVAPYGFSGHFFCSGHGCFATWRSRFFRVEAGSSVAIGCVEADMTKPPTYDVEFDTRLEQMGGCRMAHHTRGYVA